MFGQPRGTYVSTTANYIGNWLTFFVNRRWPKYEPTQKPVERKIAPEGTSGGIAKF